ncbi:DUF2752 domain-containing protein [Streptomyces sp. NPDC060035]|uniref:DUF2752 domain-containing protein n=1 Tax=Streptomyces sp. NPDC060035 TaxID=3347044 RepID=UPI0036ABB0F1
MDASPSPAAPDPAPVPGPPGRPYARPDAAGHEPVMPHAAAPVPRLRRLGTPVGVMAVVIGAFGYVATVDPNEPGHYPVCPMLRFTGVFCPGCGGLRSAHAFAHGDIAAALGSNALAVVGYAVFAVVWLLWMVRASRGEPLRIGLAPVYWWGVGAVLLIFSVVRNLPFGSGLAP